MEEDRVCKPITDEFISRFLLEAQHHSGLPFFNRLSIHYATGLSIAAAPDDMLDHIMDEFVNNYMIMVHKIHQIKHKQRGWKSYDW